MYKFATLEEVSKLVDSGRTVDFTLDIKEYLSGEPTGWYGCYVSKEFDGWTFLVGYYGDGIVYHGTTNSLDDLREFLDDNGMKGINELCIDVGGEQRTAEYELLELRKDNHGTKIAIIDKHIKSDFCRYIVAWNFDEDSATWGQGHYFNSMEEAEKYYKDNYA